MSNREAAAASERPLPPLSEPRFYSGKGERFGAQVTGYYTAEQMHAYALADRAASAPQAVRMLTKEEAESVVMDYYKRRDVAIQRKFCEVNGLGIVPLAPQDSTKEGT